MEVIRSANHLEMALAPCDPELGPLLVENVIQCGEWKKWDRWVEETAALGYDVRDAAPSFLPLGTVLDDARDAVGGMLWASPRLSPAEAAQVLASRPARDGDR